MTHDNETNETFVRTAPPLTRFTVALPLGGVGPAPWEILTADLAREIAQIAAALLDFEDWQKLRRYADAVDAMTRPERDMVTTDEELFF